MQSPFDRAQSNRLEPDIFVFSAESPLKLWRPTLLQVRHDVSHPFWDNGDSGTDLVSEATMQQRWTKHKLNGTSEGTNVPLIGCSGTVNYTPFTNKQTSER